MSGSRRRRPRNRPDSGQYPFLTLAQYGPDDRRVTKLVLSVVEEAKESEHTNLYRWIDADVKRNARVRAEMLRVAEGSRIRGVVYTRGVLGCVHEEGEDYPPGMQCPYCPFWQNRDRWMSADPVYVRLSAPGDLRDWLDQQWGPVLPGQERAPAESPPPADDGPPGEGPPR